jgi:hypothetical protein
VNEGELGLEAHDRVAVIGLFFGLEGFYEKGIDSPGIFESENVNRFGLRVSIDH